MNRRLPPYLANSLKHTCCYYYSQKQINQPSNQQRVHLYWYKQCSEISTFIYNITFDENWAFTQWNELLQKHHEAEKLDE